MEVKACALCNNTATHRPLQTYPLTRIDCETCGRYDTDVLEAFLPDHLTGKAHLLSALTRRAWEAGNPITITMENVDALLDSVPIPTPLDQMNQALLYMSAQQERADQFVAPDDDKDYPLVTARDGQEFSYFLETLNERGLLEQPDVLASGEPGQYRLTPEGWSAVEQLRKSQPDSSQAFVAMWFTDELPGVWGEGFKPALETMGFTPIRIDLVQHNDKIDDRIVAEIRRSGLLVADLTGNRGGVYFEAGFAMGLSIPVIWSCKDGGLGEVHFDTRQYNFIVWKDPQELARKLEDRIAATIPGRATPRSS